MVKMGCKSLRCQDVLLKWTEWKNESAAVEAVMTLSEQHSCQLSLEKSKEIMKTFLKDGNYCHCVGLKGFKAEICRRAHRLKWTSSTWGRGCEKVVF